MHNELGKKHSFYKRTPTEEAEMAMTMNSLQWGTAKSSRQMMSPQPVRSKPDNLIKDDGNKKAILLQ